MEIMQILKFSLEQKNSTSTIRLIVGNESTVSWLNVV